MSGYLERLRLAEEEAPRAAVRVALLTGQSSLVSSALSPAQTAFLEAVAPAGASIVRIGFPFDSTFFGDGFGEAGMLAASWRNARQVVWSVRSRAYCEVVERRLEALRRATSRRLILITGSCGLQLANAAWPGGARVEVVALGPACLGPVRFPVTVVQGRGDGWSRLLYRGRVDHFCECGHLDYWESAEVRELVKGLAG